MQNQQMQPWGSKLAWVKILVVILLVLGILFRFVNLDRKVYWYDETLTSLRIFGHTRTELVNAFRGQIVSVAELQKYQHPSPDRGWDDTLLALAGNAEHPPLYFLLARLWASVFGSSVAAMRAFPAVTSLLAFPCAYWLCRELFGSSLTGWVMIALIAVSPFHVLYAQEARAYSLWTVIILLSGAALLRAVRLNTRGSWAGYGATVALGLYTHILGGLVPLAHGVYLLICHRRLKTMVPYLLTSIAGLVAFLPWIVVILNSLQQIHSTTEGVRKEMSIDSLIERWMVNLNRVFLDISLNDFDPILLVLVIFVLYWLCRKTPPATWVFILTLIAVTALPLVVPDLTLGGRRSGALRYLIPCYLAIQLAVARYLAVQLTASGWRHKVGRTALVSLVLAGGLSCALSAQADVWWIKSVDRSGSYPAIARIINRADTPLVITDSTRAIGVLSLSHLLEPKVNLQLLRAFRGQQVPDRFSDVFVLDGSKEYFRRLRRQQNMNTVQLFHITPRTFSLWRLQRRSSA
jgi:uncharacterized membrane protein